MNDIEWQDNAGKRAKAHAQNRRTAGTPLHKATELPTLAQRENAHYRCVRNTYSTTRALLRDLPRVAARTITALIRTTLGEPGLSVDVDGSPRCRQTAGYYWQHCRSWRWQ